MPRDLPISNGNVLINFDKDYNLRDIYFPYVGEENQTLGRISHFGVWTPEGFSWIDHPDMQKRAGYVDDSLVTEVSCKHPGLGLELTIHDTVDAHADVMIRQVQIHNLWQHERSIKVYFHLDLQIYGSPIGDTVYYSPDLESLVYYKGGRYFSLTCQTEDQKKPCLGSYATGKKAIQGMEGTWKDAEDGQLGRNPISQGSVDGTIEMEMTLPANGKKTGWFRLSFGKNMRDITKMEKDLLSSSPGEYMTRTHKYWKEWVGRDRHELDLLEPAMAVQYKRSLLLIRTHMDNRGAIIAANDSDILKFAKDSYSYMWPRDGALISHALDRAGYHELTSVFFDFCRRSLSTEGFMMHKYNPNGSAGSSWHPWVNPQGQKQLPIQEDETALVLYSLWHHYSLADKLGESQDMYEQFVVPAANFLIHYKSGSGLPLPSYDLWEERYGVLAFTVSTVYAGLLAAANFADIHQDKPRSDLYKDSAERVKTAVEKEMFSPQLGRFIRALYWNDQKQTYEPDLTLDASMYALFDFGLFQPDDPRMVKTMQDMNLALSVKTEVGGWARYENDYYHQISHDISRVPGNPWFICTLWYAEWLIAVAKDEQALEEPARLIRWALRHALPSGVFAEQIHPYTGEPLSVSPLAWSHASYVKVVQEYLSKLKQFRQTKPLKEQDVSDEHILQAATT